MDAKSTLVYLSCLCACAGAWKQNVLYEHPVSMNCSDPSVDGVNRTSSHWLNPNGVIINAGFTETYPTFSGDGVITASDMYLNITKILATHFGVYFCVVIKSDGSPVAIKRGVNVDGPYFGDLWEKYKNNTLVGGLTAGIFLLIAVILILAYIYRPGGPRPITQLRKSAVDVHIHVGGNASDQTPTTVVVSDKDAAGPSVVISAQKAAALPTYEESKKPPEEAVVAVTKF